MVPRVLVLEDDSAIRKLLVAALSRESLEVDAGSDGVDGLRLAREHDYAVILLDLMMPRLNGLEFIAAFRRAFPAARPVIVVITASDEFMLLAVPSHEVHAIVRKPFDVTALVAMIREVAQVFTTNKTETPTEVPPPGDAAVSCIKPPAS